MCRLGILIALMCLTSFSTRGCQRRLQTKRLQWLGRKEFPPLVAAKMATGRCLTLVRTGWDIDDM